MLCKTVQNIVTTAGILFGDHFNNLRLPMASWAEAQCMYTRYVVCGIVAQCMY